MEDRSGPFRGLTLAQLFSHQSPELADALDHYLQLYGEARAAAGSASVLQDMGTVLDFLLGKKGRQALTPLWSLYREKGEHAAFQQLLDKIRGLTE